MLRIIVFIGIPKLLHLSSFTYYRVILISIR